MKRLVLITIACMGIVAVLAVIGSAMPYLQPTDDAWFMDRMDLFRNDVDLDVFYERAAWVDEGGVPYSDDHPQEYPPLAVATFALVRFLTPSAGSFSAVMVAVMIAHFAALVFLTGRILAARSLRYGRLWLFVLPGMMYFTLWRYDVIPALWTMVATLAVYSGAFGIAFLALVIGALYKVYPAVFLLPLFMLIGGRALTEAQRTSLRRWLAWSAVIAIAACGGFVLFAGFADMMTPLAFHAVRYVERGSLPAALLALTPVPVQHFAQPGIIFLMLLCQLSPLLILAARGRVRTATDFVHACLFVLIPLTVFARFFSPQWLLWITPLALPVVGRRAIVALITFDILTYLQFPVLFAVDPYHISYDAAALLRTAVLLWIWYGSARMILTVHTDKTHITKENTGR